MALCIWMNKKQLSAHNNEFTVLVAYRLISGAPSIFRSVLQGSSYSYRWRLGRVVFWQNTVCFLVFIDRYR
jgi:hypothetical protein